MVKRAGMRGFSQLAGLILLLPCAAMAQDPSPKLDFQLAAPSGRDSNDNGAPGKLHWMGLDVTLSGLADLRLVAPSGQISNVNGGFGKLPYGNGRGSPVIPELSQTVLHASVLFTPELRAVAEIRYSPMQKTAVDLLEAYVRYRPVSTSRWRWGLRGGAFFPPVSLENTGIGWTSEWTLTPSAINAWVGEELRVLGGEATMEWRGDVDNFEFTAAIYGGNEPAGAAIDSYGWTFNEPAIGLFDHVRLPNSSSGSAAYSDEFRQFDHAIGWYAGITWDRDDLGRISLLRYDNEADPNAHDATEFGWRTRFWSLGYSTQIGPVTILAQGMVGATTIEPFAGFIDTTSFWAYYILAGVQLGDWRFAARFDQFGTTASNPAPPPKNNEHGVAITTAATWMPRKGIRVVGELVVIDYTQAQRVLIRKAPHVVETQAQLALRLSF
jgi:hypothetical protein